MVECWKMLSVANAKAVFLATQEIIFCNSETCVLIHYAKRTLKVFVEERKEPTTGPLEPTSEKMFTLPTSTSKSPTTTKNALI
jgi:hypothetical protein